MKKLHFGAVIMCILMITAVIGSAFTINAQEAGSTTDKTELVIGADYEPTSFDYYHSETDAQVSIISVVYDKLFTWVGDDLVCQLADSYEYEGEDELDLVIHLKEGINFTNGDPFTADDVLFTLEKNQSELGVAVKFACVDLENSYARDDYTVELHLFEYDNTLLPYLAGEFGNILDKEYIEAQGWDQGFEQNPIGTGPYVIENWNMGDSVSLVPNDQYWGSEEEQPFERITFKFFQEDSIRSLEFEQGNVDVAFVGTSASVDRLSGREADGIRVATIPLTKIGDFCMATIIDDDTFVDENKRLAVAYAIDIEAIVETIAGSTAIPATSIIPSGCEGYQNMAYEYNPELAKEYLAKAGCPDGFTFTMEVANNQQLNLELAEAIQAYLSMVGINMVINPVDFFTQFSNMLAGNQLCSIMVATANGDASMALAAFEPGSGLCISENHDEEFVRLAGLVRHERDKDQRMEYLAQLQQYVHDKAFTIPVYERVYALAYHDYVSGVEECGIKGENMIYANRISFNR